ncbi:MAG: EFR1 family ferrodoxin [Christensenellales bacterium]
MKAVIYIFTGSNNTERIANCFAEEFKSNGVETDVFIWEKDKQIPNPNDYDLVGLGFPIHGFNPPKVFIDMVKTFPLTHNKPTFMFKVGGEPLWLNNSAGQKTYRILKRKGYKFLTDRLFVMPYNMIFRHNDGMAKHMWIYAKAYAKVTAQDVLEGKCEKVKLPFIKRMHSFFFRIEWGFYKLNGKFFKVKKDKCVDCGKCVRICPAKNISVKNGKIKFGGNCIMCTRCSFNCPTNAINIGLLNAWKVNGSYRLDNLEKDDNLQFPYITENTKGGYKLYKKYYQRLDKLLAEHNVTLTEQKND